LDDQLINVSSWITRPLRICLIRTMRYPWRLGLTIHSTRNWRIYVGFLLIWPKWTTFVGFWPEPPRKKNETEEKREREEWIYYFSRETKTWKLCFGVSSLISRANSLRFFLLLIKTYRTTTHHHHNTPLYTHTCTTTMHSPRTAYGFF